MIILIIQKNSSYQKQLISEFPNDTLKFFEDEEDFKEFLKNLPIGRNHLVISGSNGVKFFTDKG